MPARPETFGDRIRRLRSLTGVTARELDRLSGVAEGLTSQIESGAKTRTTGPTIEGMADVFGVTIDWIWRGRGETPSNDAIVAAVARARRRAAA